MTIPLRWIKDDIEGARKVFREEGGRWFYLVAPIHADFRLSHETLAPYVTRVLDLAAPLEGAGLIVKLIEIKNGKVRVW